MSPQFVDFNADGHLDIVAGIFDGSPHVAYGSEQGFKAPAQILDAQGERIVLNQYWDFDKKQWVTTRRFDAKGAIAPEGQCTSAVAFDWDNDGDFDLLLGDYKTGRMYRRVNAGKAGAPKFESLNVPVMAGDELLEVPNKFATLRLVDWDKDGRIDLVCSSIGHADEAGGGGGVYLFRNTGRAGAPAFAKPLTLIAPGGTATTEPVRPDVGLYPDVADVDGDGDFDLIVGGSAQWKPPARKLTEAEEQRVSELYAELAQVEAALDALYDGIEAEVKGLAEDLVEKRRAELREKRMPELRALSKQRAKARAELEPLTFGPKSEYSVWLYRNEG